MYLDSSKLSEVLFKAIRVTSKAIKDPIALEVLSIAERSHMSPNLRSKDLLTYAYINKVLSLLVLHEAEVKQFRDIRRKVLRQRRIFLTNLNFVVKTLNDCHLDYVVFKTIKPVPETPVDIDILVESKVDAYRAVSCLKRSFHVEIWNIDRYSIGIRLPDNGEFIDFYVMPHVANFVYLDSKFLIENRIYFLVNELGVEALVPVPSPELEYCSVLAHSIVKEGLITLNDVISLIAYKLLSNSDELRHWLSKFSLSIANKLFYKTLDYMFPVRINYKARFAVLTSLLKKRYAFSSLPYFVSSLIGRVDQVIEQRKKITYVRGFQR